MATIETRIAGVSFPNSDGQPRQDLLAWCEVGHEVKLLAEPQNPHDRFAIKVMHAMGQLGYLSSEIAFAVRHLTFPRMGEITRISETRKHGKTLRGAKIKFADDGKITSGDDTWTSDDHNNETRDNP